MSAADGLHCEDLTMRFGGLTALDRFSINVRPGEFVGLLGPNGSGKTTFFNVITGLYKPSGGVARFAGADLHGQSPTAISRAGVARTFQRCRLMLELSVFDNIVLGDQRQLDTGWLANLLLRSRLERQLAELVPRVRELCERFNPLLADRLFAPAGSFGMIDRRRIELCRAMVGSPRLLLLDEPSAGMTQDETFRLMDDVVALQKREPGLAVVLIEHEMSVIQRTTSRCVVLNFGKKICEGSYSHIAADTQVQAAYLGASA